jgi:hypothetical protein
MLLTGVVLGQAVQAQSPATQATRTYDTALTSDGFGIYHIRVPQFSPDSGTLMSVKISALVNTSYGFTLRNADSFSTTYNLTVGLQDEFSGPALPATYSNIATQSLGTFPMTAGQSVTQAPVSLLQGHVSTDTITSVAGFLGKGEINLQYQAFTFTNLNAINNASYYYSAGISNTMTFSVQYQFKPGGVILPTNLSGWAATPVGPRNVQLLWAATDETTGRQYMIQRGADDQHFEDIATLPATADGNMAHYEYPDELPIAGSDAVESNWYYRLRIVDATGAESYSPIRSVKMGGVAKGVQVYPNPATSFINVVPDAEDATDWQVDIVATNGIVVQRNVFMQSKNMTVNFQNRMAAGTYFVRATDLRGQKTVTSRFIVPEGR